MASEAHIFRLIDNAHASTADFSKNAIVGDCLADHEGPLAAMLGRPGAGVNHYVGIAIEAVKIRPPPGTGALEDDECNRDFTTTTLRI
jgi:hypothetical protein